MSTACRSSAAILTIAICATLFPATPAIAGDLEEVLVSATYRDSSLQTTAGSITVLTEEIITERAARHLQDILNAAPNVTWSAASSRSRFIQIRGIGDLEQYYDPKNYPSVGVMLDQLELGDSANAGMLHDIAQVEILRGPQGTRFGSSAHAGMVKLRSNDPTGDFEGEVSAGAGNHDSYNLGLVLSGPLGDSAGARLALQQNLSDGFIDNDRLDTDDSNDFDELTARAKLLWQPGEASRYQLGVLYFDADNGYDAWSIDNNRTTYTDQPGHDAQETMAVTAGGTWEWGASYWLEASLSYIDSDLSQSYDADWVSDQLCEFTCSGGNDTAREIFDRQRDRVIADVRLLGGSDQLAAGESRYVLGLYANDSNEDFDYAFPSIWYGDFTSSSEYETERLAVYGEFEFAASERLTLVAAGRLERFDEKYSDTNGFKSAGDEDLWNAELSAKYALADNSLLYATLARGAKPGGVNTSASANQPFMSPVFQTFIADNLTFEDETLKSAELGLRNRLFDGRLDLSFALFYTKREDAQLENWMWDTDAALWVGYLDSNSDATSYGAELETTLSVTRQLELFANLGWLDTEVDHIETFDLNANAFVTKEDRDQAKSPQYKYNLGARVAFTDRLSGHVEVEGQDDTNFGYYHDGELDSYDLFNASLNWQSGNIALTLWGRNLTDEDYAVHGLYFGVDPRDDFAAWSNQTYEQLGEPRTYGLDLRYSF